MARYYSYVTHTSYPSKEEAEKFEKGYFANLEKEKLLELNKLNNDKDPIEKYSHQTISKEAASLFGMILAGGFIAGPILIFAGYVLSGGLYLGLSILFLIACSI